jgi:hypothetical protein
MPKKQTTQSSTGETLTPLTHELATAYDNSPAGESGTRWIIKALALSADLEQQLTASLRREDEAREKLNQILTDVNYEGGLQYWIQKHDKLLISLAHITEEFGNAMTKEREHAERLYLALKDWNWLHENIDAGVPSYVTAAIHAHEARKQQSKML